MRKRRRCPRVITAIFTRAAAFVTRPAVEGGINVNAETITAILAQSTLVVTPAAVTNIII
jgi:hypothetical protein